jgi:hypothetical protein
MLSKPCGRKREMSKIDTMNANRKCLNKTASVYLENEDFDGIRTLLKEFGEADNLPMYMFLLHKLYDLCKSKEQMKTLCQIRKETALFEPTLLLELLLRKEQMVLFDLGMEAMSHDVAEEINGLEYE